ncbi:MAG: DUF4386 domain-containing protein [Chthoniobacterales bacterium]
MTTRSVESSPQLYARLGGLLYLILIILGFFGQYVLGKVIVSDNAAATAVNISSMESLWRLGIAAEIVALICVTCLAAIYFLLLRPVSRELNLLATFLRFVGIAVEAVVTLDLVGALLPLGKTASLKAFTQEQLYALTNLALKSHGQGYALALLFFGACFLIHGHLIFKSGFLPKTLGVLIQIAGTCYLTNSFAVYLAPAFADQIFPAILLPAFFGEASLCLWLLLKGVNVERWNEQARAERSPDVLNEQAIVL